MIRINAVGSAVGVLVPSAATSVRKKARDTPKLAFFPGWSSADRRRWMEIRSMRQESKQMSRCGSEGAMVERHGLHEDALALILGSLTGVPPV
ncbi:hypothetical protein ACVDG5_024860 [Mesorhizobium sp. ORM6]